MPLSHPFRFGPTGQAVVVEDGTDPARVEAIASIALTRKGERPLVLEFGVTDPVYDELDVTELNAVLAAYDAGAIVTEVDVDYPDDVTAAVTLTYDEA